MKNKILYQNFLKDNRIYSLTKNWWKREFCKKMIIDNTSESEKDKKTEWIFNWHNENFNNNKELRDGNPIFTVFSIKQKKLVRIIQEEIEPQTSQDAIQINAWLEKGFYSDTEQQEETPELVIALELSKKSSKIAFEWIKKWFDNELKEEDLEIDLDEKTSEK